MVLRNDWQREEVREIFSAPVLDLLMDAQTIHRENFPKNQVQISRLLSIKTGACPEDCNYCTQSGHYKTDLEREKLLDIEKVKQEALEAKRSGATRFCMGGAWRSPPKKAMPQIVEMIKEVKALGMETCMTLGMLDEEQTQDLKDAGLDYYNHNIDTSKEYYEKVITTRTFQDRIDTIDKVRNAGINVCCGGIMGLGESREDRVGFLYELATMPKHPDSVPINRLIAMKGTPQENQKELDAIEFVRTIATARILMPKSYVRLSAGRSTMSSELQAMCFMAGANSIHLGAKLLTADNPTEHEDIALFEELGLQAEVA